MHPNQEPAVIAGQGTIALEVLEQVREMHSPAPAGAQEKGGHKVSEALTLPFCTGPPGKCSGGSCRRWRNACRNSSRHQGRQQLIQESPCGNGRTLKAGSSFLETERTCSQSVSAWGLHGSSSRPSLAPAHTETRDRDVLVSPTWLLLLSPGFEARCEGVCC